MLTTKRVRASDAISIKSDTCPRNLVDPQVGALVDVLDTLVPVVDIAVP